MIKKALYVQRKDVARIYKEIPQVLTNGEVRCRLLPLTGHLLYLDSAVGDRAVIETDSSKLQIIPYITLMDQRSKKIFIYQRGEGGTEERLHGMCSIGLGGHVEEETNYTRDMKSVIIECIVRELAEEVGLIFTPTEVMDLSITTSSKGYAIYDDSDAVGKVHLGIGYVMSIDKARLQSSELDVITNGKWLSIPEIKSGVAEGIFKLENWSKLVMTGLDNSI